MVKNYYWTIRQSEYATDIMFRDRESLAQIYPQLVNHAITEMSSEDILSYLERRTNIRFSGEVKNSLQKRTMGTRVKHWVEENSIKMYDKKGSVLRVETTINNPWRFRVRREVVRKGERVMAWQPMRKGIADMLRRVEISHAANERYFQALSVVGNPQPSYRLLDTVSKAIVDKPRRYRSLRPIAPDDSQLFTVIMRGEFALQGFRNRDLRTHLKDYTAARLTRLLALLRAHKLIYKVHKTNYYRITEKGRLIMSTALKFRQTSIALLAA